MSVEPAAKPMAEGIFTPAGADGRAHLLCSRCACGAVAFPARQRCAACSGTDLTVEEVPNEGKIYSWTTSPGRTVRVVAQVQFANGLMAQGHVTAQPEDVRIDQRVRTVAVPVDYGDDGTPLLSYAFELIGEAG
jgi:uncharacterized OB-fold protein